MLKSSVTCGISALCAAMLLAQSAYALEKLDDGSLASATGEGIALLPENFSMRFNGADTANNGLGTAGTGYIRLIPVGPLSAAEVANGAKKADGFIYGVAISKADSNANTQFSGTPLASWGTVDNPWLLKVKTETVPNFAGQDSSLSYVALETPDVLPIAAQTTDDYHLKLGLWADIFSRDPSVSVNDATPSTWANGLSNRLRLQLIANDFSLNGTKLQIFQTPGGADDTNGMSKSYNNTLGMAGMVRLNMGDSQNLRAKITATASNRALGTWSATQAASGCTGTAANFAQTACQFRFQDRTVTDTQSNVSWTLDNAATNKVIRLSTREANNTSPTDLNTPAINGGVAPTFANDEGLYIYNLNANIVLGSLNQPLTFNAEGKNLVLEVARIANQPSIYQKIYTDYDNPNSATYVGSTCNVYQCGRTVNGIFYPATHSSVSMGSTTYSSTNNILSAYNQSDAIGISFGATSSNFMQSGTFSKTYNEVQFQQRQVLGVNYTFTDRYGLYDIGGNQPDPYNSPLGNFDGSGLSNPNYVFRWYNVDASHNFWGYVTGFDQNGKPVTFNDGGRYLISSQIGDNCTNFSCLGGKPVGSAYGQGAADDNYTTAYNNLMTVLNNLGFIAGIEECPSGAVNEDRCSGRTEITLKSPYGYIGGVSKNIDLASEKKTFSQTPTSANNNDWNYARGNVPWFNSALNSQAAAQYTVNTGKNADIVPTQITAINPSPLNNLGSAVIDGMLIQHMKLTTKGL